MKFLLHLYLAFYSSLIMASTDFYSIEVKTIKGEKITMSQFKGQTLLIVNIASRCGYTPQLESLQQLYEKFRQKNFAIIGVPSNEFGGQTPESDGEMANFCKLNYGVNFPLLSKSTVKGTDKHPLYKFLVDEKGNSKEVGWNFEKFLIDKNGNYIERFTSGDSPLGDKVTTKINELLK